MPVPKRKRSRARRDSRFANKGIKVKSFSSCAHCQEPILPHQVCSHCGYYKGKKILTTKIERALKRGEARKVAQQKSHAQPEQGSSEQ